MRRFKRFVAALVLLVPSFTVAAAPEFRGVWVTRFEWPQRDPGACKAAIDGIMKKVAAHRFNAVIFQMRGQCDTLYPSPEEPWSPIISPDGSDPGWDPMRYAIDAAHANRLEFHAYLNTHVAWQSQDHKPPATAAHVFFTHFNAADPGTCDWLVHDSEGKPVQWDADDYVWIAPGVPAAQAYTRRQIMHVVNTYDLDGIHFDRIRTPSPDCSHDPVSGVRQATGSESNPAGLDFTAWTADQITRFLCDLYAEAAEVKPRLKMSAAPLGLVSRDRYPEYPPDFQYGVTKCCQDAQAWLAAGALDFVVPQIYWGDNDRKPPDFSRVLPDWLDHAAGRHVYPGQAAKLGVRELIHQAKVTREKGGLGNVVFSYRALLRGNGFGQYSRRGGLYAEAVPTPALPWKDNPAEGIILGTITDGRTNEPITDVQVRRSGSDYVALSGADGLYSFLKVPPGRYTLRLTKHGMSEQQVPEVIVAAGQVLRINASMGITGSQPATSSAPASGPAPATSSAPATAPNEPVATQPVIVAQTPPTMPAARVEPCACRARWIPLLLIVAGVAFVAVALVKHFRCRRKVNDGLDK